MNTDASAAPQPDPIELLGIRFAPLTKDQLLAFIAQQLATQRPTRVLSGNVHAFNLAADAAWLHAFFNAVEAVRIDGAGLRLGAHLLGHRLPPRMTWADFFWDLVAQGAARGWRFYFLGGRPGVAAAAAAAAVAREPALQIAGVHHGFFDKEPGPANSAVIDAINAVAPDVLIIGFGMPLQERWLRDNFGALRVGVALTGGAVFDYVSGNARRAPRWMTDHGLEWLGRLLLDPVRLWRRYVIGNPRFMWRVLRRRLRGDARL